MSTSPDKFDPLAVLVDCLGFCRLGKLDALLNLYEREPLECDCEHVVLAGRESIALYWPAKLERRLSSAFTLDDIILTDSGTGRLPRLRRRSGPNSLSFQSLGQDTPHKLHAAGTSRGLETVWLPLFPAAIFDQYSGGPRGSSKIGKSFAGTQGKLRAHSRRHALVSNGYT
jgi:hypothetical protein